MRWELIRSSGLWFPPGVRVAARARRAFVVGDARFLPFRSGSFDYVWSYSVLQHFSREMQKCH